MKPKVFFCVVLIMLCIISCSRKEGLITADVIEFDSFAKEFHKTAQPSVTVMGAYGIAICENMLIIITSNPNARFSIMDLDTGKMLFEGGANGRGPNEFITLTTNFQFVNRDGHICLWVRERDTRNVLMDLNETIERQTIVSRESWQFGRGFRQMNAMLVLPSGECFVKFPVTYKDPRDNIEYYPQYLYFYDDEKVRELPFFKSGSFLLPESDHEAFISSMFHGVTCLKPDGTKAVDALFNVDYLNFLDLTKNRGFSMHYSKGWSVDYAASAPESELRKNFVWTYEDVAVTDDYVLALYSGNPEAPQEVDPNRKSAIRIFDWTGKPLALVHVDKELHSIAYDQRTKRLYALDLEENIMYYNLGDVI